MKVTRSSWREDLTQAMAKYGESWEDVDDNTLSGEVMDKQFNHTCCGKEGVPFFLWTQSRVYFSMSHGGVEWVHSVPRNPSVEVPQEVK